MGKPRDSSSLLDLANTWMSISDAIKIGMRSTTTHVRVYFDALHLLLPIFKRENNISFLSVSLLNIRKEYAGIVDIQKLIGIFHQPYCKITKLYVSTSVYIAQDVHTCSVQDDQMESFIYSTIARPMIKTLHWYGDVSPKMITALVKEISTAPIFRKLRITKQRADCRPLLDVAHYLHVLEFRCCDIQCSDAPDLWAGERKDSRLVSLSVGSQDDFKYEDTSMYFTTTFIRMELKNDNTSLWEYRNPAFHFFYIPIFEHNTNERFRIWTQGRLFLHSSCTNTNAEQRRLYKTLAKKFLPFETQQVMNCTKLDRWIWNRPCIALGYGVASTSLSMEFSIFL